MLRYSKSNNQERHAPRLTGFNGLLNALSNVTLERGRGREVVVPDWLSNAVAAGKGEALTHLAGLHLGALRNGLGLGEAEPLLQVAAENGYALAQEQLGIINLFGVGCDPAPSEAADWLWLAADQGKMGAQSLLGMMLAAGAGIERDLAKAKQQLALAGEQGETFARIFLNSGSDLGLLPQIATFSLGMLRVMASVIASLPDDACVAELQRGIRASADAGDEDACLVLSILSHSSDNGAEALHWCLAAADAGSELAALMVGLLAFTDHDGITDKYPVAEWLDAAASQDSAPAQGLLGLMYETGRGVRHDFTEASRLLGQAAQGMDPTTALGRLIGSPVTRPYLEASMHLLGKALSAQLCCEGSASFDRPFNLVHEAMRLAEQGDRFAQFFVSSALWSGQEVKQDRAEAARWMQKAAGQGHKEAQCLTGINFDMGDGVDRDRAEAMRWFRLAAEQGHTTAVRLVASACMRGDGVEKDLAEAARWFRLAADQGDASAQYNLGCALLEGEGVEQNPVAGAQWLLESAKQGHAEAQFLTGLCFINGDGVEKDMSASLHWLFEAAGQESQNAIEFLSKIR